MRFLITAGTEDEDGQQLNQFGKVIQPQADTCTEVELREQMVQTVRELYEVGLITPTGGNLSVRLPEDEGYLITPSRFHKGGLCAEDMIRLDPTGKAAAAVKGRPSVETPMHLKVYELRPRCGAVIHTHAPWATLFGLLELKVEPVTVEAIPFLDTPLVPFHMPGSRDLVTAVERALTDGPGGPAVLLQNHGLLTYAGSLRDAANAALALEEVCHLLINCRLLDRTPVLIPEQAVSLLRKFLVG